MRTKMMVGLYYDHDNKIKWCGLGIYFGKGFGIKSSVRVKW